VLLAKFQGQVNFILQIDVRSGIKPVKKSAQKLSYNNLLTQINVIKMAKK